MKISRALLAAAILQVTVWPHSVAQDNSDAITKYTVRQYLEVNLPPQEGRKIVLDEITGLLTITDTPKNQELALRLIREWDAGLQQVQIEAKFIEITFTDIDELGVDWDLYFSDGAFDLYSPTGTAAGLGTGSVQGLMGAWGSVAQFAQAANTAGMGFWVGKATMDGMKVLAYLKALSQSGKANLLHAPRITTLSGQMANLQVIRTFPYATSTETTQVEWGVGRFYPVRTYKVAEEIVGVTLEVTPTVMEGSDIITLELHPEVTALVRQVPLMSEAIAPFPRDLGWPIIDTRTTQTSIMISSGQTIMIGGLIQDLDNNSVERKIPILSDIPLFGNVFKYKYENREKKNLVIFLTAKLINTQGDEVLR